MALPALDRKLLRDLNAMRGQAIAIGLVLVAGVTTYVSMLSILDTLSGTLDLYYQEYRFADGFASVRRAPEPVAERLRGIPGIGTVQTGVTTGANLTVPGFDDAVTGLLVSLPKTGQPALNRLYLRQGRLADPAREDEVVLNEPFANAHGLEPGDPLPAVIEGRRRTLTIVGIALSPAYLMQIQPGSLFPDPERFGVLWMGRGALAAASGMEGAFNEVAFTLTAGARIDDVLDRVDRVLSRYGGAGAYGRSDHTSHVLISEELSGLEGMGSFLPVVFLAVAAFLLNIVVRRLIGLQREQIGILKAFGYGNRAVGLHYVKLVLAIAVAGSAVGALLGLWATRGLGQVYLEFYNFPYLDHVIRPSVVLTAIGLTAGASLAGVLGAVRQAVRLSPAEAMRPAPPAHYRSTVVERLGFQRLLDQPTRMILRNLERRPLRAFLTVVGIATACGILVTGLFFDDVIDHIVLVEYGVAQREDVTVSFVEPTSMGALPELRALAGVQHVEPFRSVPVRIRHGHRSYQAGMEGIPAGSYLRRVIDKSARPVRIPAHGLLLSQRLAEVLDAQPGDSVRVEILEGHRRTRSVPVSGLAEQYIGLGAYMEMDALNRLMGEGPALSGAYLLTDERYEEALRTELRDRPRVASIVSQDQSVQAYLDTAAQSMLVFMFVLTLFAGVIAFGVVYNNMRIALSERDRELASLRVLGFRRGEIAYILLGEMALLVLVSIPLGFGLGAALAAWSVAAFQTDMYSFPVVFSRGTFGTAAAIVLAAATLSGLMVRRRLNLLDLIGVLKTRE